MSEGRQLDFEPLRRRAACVLSLDVVAFSRLMSQNDMAAVNAVRACRRIVTGQVARFGGRVFGAAGDSFMADFPDALSAVQAAIAIQKEVISRNQEAPENERLLMRAGVAIGEVIDDDGNLYGDVVNIAARLQEVCQPGGVVVGRAVESAVKGRIDLRPAGELSLKNIATPVEMFEVLDGEHPLSAGATDLAAIDIARSVPGLEGAPVLAICTLDNAALDPEQEPVCRGFSEDLITLLSHMRQFAVLDRNSTLSLRSGQPEAHAGGRRLGARYLLEGRLSPAAAGSAISVWLTDLESDRTVWSDAYAPEGGDFLSSLQDVSRRVAGALGGRIEHAEGARFRGRRESRVGVRGLLWRSRWHLDQLTRRDAEEAFRLLQEAQQSDPDNPEVLIQLAHWRWVDAWSMRRPRAVISELREQAVAAREADTLDGRGHLLVGVSDILLGRHAEALAHLRKAVDLNPSLTMAYAQMGSCHNLMGDYGAAIAQLELALRLSPQDYYAFYVFGELAISHVLLADQPRAIAYARKALALRPSYWNARMSEIAALVHSGDLQAAALSYQTLMFRTPKFTLNYIEWLPYDAPSVRTFFAEAIEQASRVSSTLN